jgi:hypothetical protein
MTALYKVLDGGRACHGGNGEWRKGRWRSVRGELVPCVNGLHLCRPQDLVTWLGPQIWVAEIPDGVEQVDGGNKLVVRKARVVERVEAWNERTARLFACDCAERVLPLFEKKWPGDTRPREAIEVARRFANGEATDSERPAALDAAWSATWAATVSAAWSAEREWQTGRLMQYLDGEL